MVTGLDWDVDSFHWGIRRGEARVRQESWDSEKLRVEAPVHDAPEGLPFGVSGVGSRV